MSDTAVRNAWSGSIAVDDTSLAVTDTGKLRHEGPHAPGQHTRGDEEPLHGAGATPGKSKRRGQQGAS
ncbi:hypothetical protein [Myxococcus sp. AB025B]|uniref:hypothetical protein n=1 Tax=Myxococcus sp. AB025B TaxID=2562794 RepID=UPI001141A724|nr:hypothetical protein [Myxococcus sp. AB025B]